jgi:hypothetical protein
MRPFLFLTTVGLLLATSPIFALPLTVDNRFGPPVKTQEEKDKIIKIIHDHQNSLEDGHPVKTARRTYTPLGLHTSSTDPEPHYTVRYLNSRRFATVHFKEVCI